MQQQQNIYDPSQSNALGQSNVLRVSNVKEEAEAYENQFHPRIIFARKLFTKLLYQMIVVGKQQNQFLIAIFTWLVFTQPKLKQFLQQNSWLFWLTLGLVALTSTLTLVARQFCQKVPINWVIYIIFTLSLAYAAGHLVAIGNSEIGLLVFVSIASLIFFLFMYSITVKKRATYQGSILFIAASILIVFEIFTIFTTVSLFWLILISLGQFIIAFLLIYEVYTNISGGEQELSLNDGVCDSVVLYWDLTLLFLKMNEMIKDFLIRSRN
ncbi:hypothetical protein pb186bvf_000750 [Paramecium bursaria]